jgi:integrase
MKRSFSTRLRPFSVFFAFELAAETGARLGETLGLLWGEIDFDDAAVTFAHQLDCKGQRAWR